MTNNDILSKAARRSGMTVPENYFDDLSRRIAASLPPQPWEQAPAAPARRTRWQAVRPYVYLAAMFLGIWCMMQMFDLMRTPASYELSSNQSLMSAIHNDAFYFDYCTSSTDETDLYDELYEEGFDPASLTSDHSSNQSL